MYKALYRKERPETFEEVIGQEHIVKVLRNQVATDTLSHAYLFSGTRGTGKTSLARILAKGANCLEEAMGERPCGKCENCLSIKEATFIDVIELDAASNNGVDNVRELRESIKYPPAVGRKKIYIIDEVHMLSTQAFNALLKTLEEPPANTILILATTDPQKLPQTISSRCQRLEFRRVSHRDLMDHMKRITMTRGIQVSDEALGIIATNADGSVRDGLSILEQCISTGEKVIDRDLALEFLGAVPQDFFVEITYAVKSHKAGEALVKVGEAIDRGKDAKQLMKDWMAHYRNLLLAKYIENPEDILNMSSDNVKMIKTQSEALELEDINEGILALAEAVNEGRYSTQPRILLELALIKIATGLDSIRTSLNSAVEGKTFNQPKVSVNKKEVEGPNGFSEGEVVEEVKDVEPQSKLVTAESFKESEAHKHAEKALVETVDKEQRDILWNQMCDIIGQQKKSVASIRKQANITFIDENSFHIEADTDTAKERLQDSGRLVEEAAFVVMGRPLRMKCTLVGMGGEDNKNPSHNDEHLEIIDALASMFGEDLKVK